VSYNLAIICIIEYTIVFLPLALNCMLYDLAAMLPPRALSDANSGSA